MKVSIPKEIKALERRVSATPETVQKLVKKGIEVVVEEGAGLAAGFLDAAYVESGASLAKTKKNLYEKADVILKIQKPRCSEKGEHEAQAYPKNVTLIAQFNHDFDEETLAILQEKGSTVYALERLPRITRAQSMDVLSSQSNLAGYRAVLVGVAALNKALPMMMTAAGTIMPAKILVVGAGVAGLQAIATAKRLGAVVSAFDVRPAAKEQVESLGAKFIEVDESSAAETSGGYATEMDEAYKKKQAELLEKHLEKTDLVITTALIPGRPAPKIITKKMIDGMPLGSVIVDMAAEMGGNCDITQAGKTVDHKGVSIIGALNLPSELSKDSSPLFAKNILSFLDLMLEGEGRDLRVSDKGEDEILKAACVMRTGDILVTDLLDKSKKTGAPKGRSVAPKKVSSKKVGPKKTLEKKEGAPKKKTVKKTD